MALISVTISGNAAPLRNELDKAEGLFGKFGGTVTKVAAASAAAFAGVAAGLAIATKAAAEDQQSFEQLRIAIQNTTGATDAMVQAIDDQILKMAIATGVADDQLRPAYGNLIRATGDAAKAQDLLSTALDISAATGKPLEAVSIALSKAANGQVTALTRLGVPLDENAVKSKDFTAILEQLNETFGGAAAANADTFAGKIDRLKVVFGEVVETVGGALLPILSNAATFFLDKVVPAFQYFSDTVGPKLSEIVGNVASFFQDKLVPAVQEFVIPAFERMASIFLDYIVPAIKTIAIPIFDGLRAIFDKVVEKVRENRDSFQRIYDTYQTVFGFIRDKLAPVIGTVLTIAFDVAEKAIGPLIDGFFKFTDALGAVVRTVARIAGQIVDIVVGMVNTVIDGVNFLIKGFNALPDFLRFGVEISPIPNVNLQMPSFGGMDRGSGGTTWLASENRGSMPTITPSIGGGGFGGGGGGGSGGGGGAGGGARAVSPLTASDIANGNAIADFFSSGLDNPRVRGDAGLTVNVNVNQALATQAEIGDAVQQALRAANAVYGPLDFQVA